MGLVLGTSRIRAVSDPETPRDTWRVEHRTSYSVEVKCFDTVAYGPEGAIYLQYTAGLSH